MFVWIGGRGPVLGTGSGRGIPIRDFANAKLPLFPGSYGYRGKGREREGGGEAPTKPPHVAFRAYQLRGVPRKGEGREGEGFP